LASLLKKNNIAYTFGGDKTLSGYSFETQKQETFKVERNDLVLNLLQPSAVLASVLFEPQTVVSDSNTYDITAWALPYAYGLNAYAVKEAINGSFSTIAEQKETIANIPNPYAWAMSWNAIKDAQVLAELQKLKIKVRIAEEGFTIGSKAYAPGSLLIYRAENEKTNKDLAKKLNDLAQRYTTSFYPIASGYVDKGKDFGSNVYPILNTPKIAVVTGQGTSSLAVGAVWHFFEQELNYPVTMITTQNAASLDINKINVLILPDGSYEEKLTERLSAWISAGGKLILLDDAIGSFIGKKGFDIKKKEYAKKDDKVVNERKYAEKDKDDLQNSIPGAIYKVNLDQSHPLALGLGKFYYTLKTDEKIYEPLENGWNVGTLKANSYLTGVAGNNVKKKLESGLLYGVQKSGKGSVVYLGTDVLFRAFWENGKQLFTNALFLVN
jgi:hypothetical protein